VILAEALLYRSWARLSLFVLFASLMAAFPSVVELRAGAVRRSWSRALAFGGVAWTVGAGALFVAIVQGDYLAAVVRTGSLDAGFVDATRGLQELAEEAVLFVLVFMATALPWAIGAISRARQVGLAGRAAACLGSAGVSVPVLAACLGPRAEGLFISLNVTLALCLQLLGAVVDGLDRWLWPVAPGGRMTPATA
jgi:hypothetical protein